MYSSSISYGFSGWCFLNFCLHFNGFFAVGCFAGVILVHLVFNVG